MAVPETGQSRARQLYIAAVDGGAAAFELAEDVASNLAAACDVLVDDLQRARAESHLITEVSGFPDLPTGHGLARGFGTKGREYLDTLTALQETALLYKAAYLAAGKKFVDADAANKAAIDLVAAHLAPR
ncbi:hypothetical protein GV794_12670 [Nocardia cyriacigeorgica]|uniref:DUF4439 domain-containing protein n=1 Tax=Nocardia cyriacigeorgica TaxID=135487 RepID=A0A6P1D3C2_9NOCA|nr:hypothetical protein [Nocardia cyriacigeorgica]NEW39537.1 hypothetical protein [Nocardia cyriacigeorgica]NEW43951.1 hypothetical protein [Nocardia cyriacigeorgica]NEW50026.1 hypothetical protein [Nocardia cyriacigeorgica]NEW56499.1 hypothetical protein [Nocardia cyriacigeorgica]